MNHETHETHEKGNCLTSVVPKENLARTSVTASPIPLSCLSCFSWFTLPQFRI